MRKSQVTLKSGYLYTLLYDLFPVISSSCVTGTYNGGRWFDHDAPAGRQRMLRIIYMIMFWHLVLNKCVWRTSSNQVYTMGKLVEEYNNLCIFSWYYLANDNSVNLNRWVNRLVVYYNHHRIKQESLKVLQM